jgi:hypothetical protein
MRTAAIIRFPLDETRSLRSLISITNVYHGSGFGKNRESFIPKSYAAALLCVTRGFGRIS